MGDAEFGEFGADFDLFDGDELSWVGLEVGGEDVGVLTGSEFLACDSRLVGEDGAGEGWVYL